MEAGIVKTGFVEYYAKSMDKSMDEVNELEQLGFSCSDGTHNPALDLPVDSNECVNMPKKEIGKYSLLHKSLTGDMNRNQGMIW